ncbi:MAG: metal-dependent transcriptional regulator [Thermodesulforhabdaceae bacterium]
MESHKVSASLEDYLEAIYVLEQKYRVARAKDIADYMHVQRASVTGALKALAVRGLIYYTPYSYVTLTAEGKKIAEEILYRHRILKEFFSKVLKLSPEEAEQNACRIEHAIQPHAIERLVKFLEFLNRCPRAGSEWFDAFEEFCEQGISPESCRTCIEQCMEKLSSLLEPSRTDLPVPEKT